MSSTSRVLPPVRHCEARARAAAISSAGFTLLEVLIAASIFASIMLIAVTSFTRMNQLNDRSREVRAVAEAGRFVMDDLERAISSANGADAKAVSATNPFFIPAEQSMALCSGRILLGQATAAAPATKLVTATSDATGATTIRSYYVDPISKNRLIEAVKDPLTGLTSPNPITSNDVTVSLADFKLTGTSAVEKLNGQPLNIQPYVTIDLTITAVSLRPGGAPVSQNFKTSVVSRDYNVAAHGQGTLCAN